MKIVQQYKKYTDRQRSQCFIFLQGKSDFFYSFISNDIASYQGQPIMSTYQAAAYLACYYFSMLVQFPLLLHRQYYFHLQTVAIGILRYSVVNDLFFCKASPISFIPSSPILLYPTKGSDNVYIPRCSVFSVLFFCNANPISFIPSYPKQLFSVNKQYQAKYVPRFSTVNALFFCKVKPISFAPFPLKKRNPINSAIMPSILKFNISRKEPPRMNSKRWIMSIDVLSKLVQFVIKFTDNKLLDLSALINKIDYSFDILS
eukprot:TRINITY_DN2782_c0_g1_i5.p1 TRINITY_DN2782_c0_g1~~TRINITY_DN2782_c0_g1_i5.p1  ORF type:complete len:296 (+),score=-11.75 TRINITY_DN2782_c0_g1_i5:112-888(+)